MSKKSVWANTLISSDLEWDNEHKARLIQEENMLRPLFHRPAYQFTELEDKINASYKAYLQEDNN